jgi:hypothetical protein
MLCKEHIGGWNMRRVLSDGTANCIGFFLGQFLLRPSMKQRSSKLKSFVYIKKKKKSSVDSLP